MSDQARQKFDTAMAGNAEARGTDPRPGRGIGRHRGMACRGDRQRSVRWKRSALENLQGGFLAVQLAHKVTKVQTKYAIEIGECLELASGFDVRFDLELM